MGSDVAPILWPLQVSGFGSLFRLTSSCLSRLFLTKLFKSTQVIEEQRMSNCLSIMMWLDVTYFDCAELPNVGSSLSTLIKFQLDFSIVKEYSFIYKLGS